MKLLICKCKQCKACRQTRKAIVKSRRSSYRSKIRIALRNGDRSMADRFYVGYTDFPLHPRLIKPK